MFLFEFLAVMASESIDPSRSIVIPKLPPLLSSIPVLTALLKLILSDNIDFELKVGFLNVNSITSHSVFTDC